MGILSYPGTLTSEISLAPAPGSFLSGNRLPKKIKVLFGTFLAPKNSLKRSVLNLLKGFVLRIERMISESIHKKSRIFAQISSYESDRPKIRIPFPDDDEPASSP